MQISNHRLVRRAHGRPDSSSLIEMHGRADIVMSGFALPRHVNYNKMLNHEVKG
jgi:hypothetical protein